jgi:carboxylesterase
MRPLGEALAARGFPVRAVRLAGHGTDVADLTRTRWTDWLASASDGLDVIRRECPRVAIAGMSMGALLSLHLAATRPRDVSALILCGTPLRLRDTRLRLLGAFGGIPWLSSWLRAITLPKTRGPDISDPAVRAASRSYKAMPLAGVLELIRLQSVVQRELPRVTQPALLLQGRHDHNVPFDNLELLRRSLGARDVEVHVLERSWHVVTLDVERDRVASLAGDFLERIARAPDSQAAG